jgi:Transposase DDE domain
VEIYDPEQQRRLVFLSNHLQFAPTTVAAIYKERWQVELFFNALKQLCKIKTFVGTSANAVKTQVWTALIAMLLLRLEVRVRMVNLSENKFFGFEPVDVLGHKVMISDREKTAIDCIERPDLAGGLGEAATIFATASRRFDWMKAAIYLERIDSGARARRFGLARRSCEGRHAGGRS